MKMERTWIQDTLSVREERNIEIIRFAFGCKESWWRAFNSIFQCFFISLIQESTFIIWKLYKKPYESISTCTTRETEPSLPNIMRKLHLLWKFAFYLRFTLLSYSKSILSLFTHKSHDAAEHGRIHPWCLGSALSMIFFCFYLRIICYLTISPISLLLVQMCLWYYLNIVKSMKCFYILIWETVKII